ncbi:MAG TPA: tetratricopeptide repeat protein [Chthoniobacteraceae bacterium]|nr:tetratricopeptide repeat protein [Chthoniobacteraceae bacterium]
MVRKRALYTGILAASLLAGSAAARAQEVRRAIPVDGGDQDNIPTAPAVPLEPFESQPTPTPAPVASPTPHPPPVSNLKLDNIPPPAPASTQQLPDKVQLDFANGLYTHGQAEEAAPEYEKYLDTYPNAPADDRESAYFRLGECYRKIGNVNSAKNAYENVLLNFGLGPFIGPAAYRLGDMCYAAKDYDGALNYYRKASVRLNDPMVALAAKFYSARCLEALNLPSEARITYEDIIDTKGDNPYREPSRLANAEILSTFGRKEEALTAFESLARDSQQPVVKVEALVKAGLINIDLNHPEKGAAELDKALAMPEIGDWKPIAQIGLLRVLYASGKYKELLDQYQDAFNSETPDLKPEVLVMAANSKRQLGDFSGAGDIYGQIIKDYPTSVFADEARYQQLVALYISDDPKLIPAIDAYLANKPDPTKSDQVTLLKAEELFKEGKYTDAAPVYASLENSTLTASYRANALFKLGWCYMQTRQPDLAVGALTKFVKEYPDSKMMPAALAQRAVAYQETKDLTSALKDFNRLLDDYPGVKERELALQQKALILGQQDDNAGMSQAFQQLLREYPHTAAAAQANYWIGSAAYSAKDYKACIAPLETARKMDKAEFFERATVRIIAAYYTLGDRDKLAAEVDLYNNGHPKDKVQAEVLRSLGKSYLDAKDYANAQKYLDQLTTRDEVTADDWMNLAKAQLGGKQYADCINSIGRYLDSRKDPLSQANGLLVMGRAQIEAGKLDDAQVSADKICSLQPEGQLNAQGRMLSGDIQVARGKYDDASKIYQSIAVIIDDPQITPSALEKAYECLNRLGNTGEASKVLNQLQTKYPEYQIKSSLAQ